MQCETSISQRRACSLVGISRAAFHYQSSRQSVDAGLSERIQTLANERRRFGYRRVHQLLRREGVTVNHKRSIGFTARPIWRFQNENDVKA